MRGSRWALVLAPMIAPIATAAAQTAPPAPITVSGTATLVSDYRFRGLSQSNRDPAVQASLSVDTLAGAYASVWTSTIGRYADKGAGEEVDLIAGYRAPLGGTTVDAGLLYYVYPGRNAGPTDSAEPFVSVSRTYGPLTGKIGANVAWKQQALGLAGRRRGGAYLYGDLSAGIPRTPVTLTAGVGHSFVANAITFGRRYTDWSLDATYVHRRITLGIGYADTDTRVLSYPTPGSRNDRNIAGSTLLGSVGLSF